VELARIEERRRLLLAELERLSWVRQLRKECELIAEILRIGQSSDHFSSCLATTTCSMK